MKVRLNPALFFSEYQYSKKLRLTREFQTVSVKVGNELLRSEYNGKPLVISDDPEAGEAKAEEAPEANEEVGDTEGDS